MLLNKQTKIFTGTGRNLPHDGTDKESRKKTRYYRVFERTFQGI